jgi:hypothetical protein
MVRLRRSHGVDVVSMQTRRHDEHNAYRNSHLSNTHRYQFGEVHIMQGLASRQNDFSSAGGQHSSLRIMASDEALGLPLMRCAFRVSVI